jgi:hypothetical protein
MFPPFPDASDWSVCRFLSHFFCREFDLNPVTEAFLPTGLAQPRTPGKERSYGNPKIQSQEVVQSAGP